MDKDNKPGKRPPARRAKAAPKTSPKASAKKPAAMPEAIAEPEAAESERIAKRLARAGLCSRREAETWISAGRVAVNGVVLETPAFTVTASDRIEVDGKPLPATERTRLWLYHKPAGLVTTNRDPQGRPTVFERLPPELPRVMTVGRLDINTEGLLLLTNDGGLARVLELPATGWLRRYRVRAHGRVRQEDLDRLREGVAVDGVLYGPIEATVDREQGANVWLTVGLREGKNREVKNVLGSLGLIVSRLIRLSFGPFQLADLAEGEVREIRGRMLRDQLGDRLIAEAGADFDAPILKPFDPKRSEREEAEAQMRRPRGDSIRHTGKNAARNAGRRSADSDETRARPQRRERRERDDLEMLDRLDTKPRGHSGERRGKDGAGRDAKPRPGGRKDDRAGASRASAGGRADERRGPAGDRPRGNKPRQDRPRNERPRNDRPRNDRPRNDRFGDKPAGRSGGFSRGRPREEAGDEGPTLTLAERARPKPRTWFRAGPEGEDGGSSRPPRPPREQEGRARNDRFGDRPGRAPQPVRGRERDERNRGERDERPRRNSAQKDRGPRSEKPFASRSSASRPSSGRPSANRAGASRSAPARSVEERGEERGEQKRQHRSGGKRFAPRDDAERGSGARPPRGDSSGRRNEGGFGPEKRGFKSGSGRSGPGKPGPGKPGPGKSGPRKPGSGRSGPRKPDGGDAGRRR
jgi:23S rRNA pseudouridine2605 synthase